MSEAHAILQAEHHCQRPGSYSSLVEDLHALEIEAGSVLLVHSSLSALGWISGGPVAVVLALQTVLGPTGTLMMPTHSGDLSDPAAWRNPPVPSTWWQIIRDTMPAYDPHLTPTRKMGAIVECFRRQPGTLRSPHPQHSFAARGPRAAALVGSHPLNDGLGEESPLGALYRLDGWVLLLGVGHGNNTSLHLAESRARWPGKQRAWSGAPMLVDGERRWVRFEELEYDDDDFPRIGSDFARDTGREKRGPVGCGTALLFRQRELVDYAVTWMERNRPART